MKVIMNGSRGFWSGYINAGSVQFSFPALNKSRTIPQKFKASIKVAAAQLEQGNPSELPPAILGSDAESDDLPRTAPRDKGPATKKKTAAKS